MKISMIRRPDPQLTVKDIPVKDLFAVFDPVDTEIPSGAEPKIYMRVGPSRGRGAGLRAVDIQSGELVRFAEDHPVEPAEVIEMVINIGHVKYSLGAM